MPMALQTVSSPCNGLFRLIQLVTKSLHTTATQSNSNRSCVVRLGRKVYERMYPVLLVRPDGSTIIIRYPEPRRILQMPLDITTLSEEEKKIRLRKRQPKKVQKTYLGDHDDDFKIDDYSKFWKKK